MDILTSAQATWATPPHSSDGPEVEKEDEKAVSPWVVTIARKEFEVPPADRINTSSFGCVLVRFRSPAAHRLQLRATSAGIWFPQQLSTGIAESFSFLTSQAPASPALAIALDAGCLIQIGQERGDGRMLLEGQRMYCDALKFLRAGLSQPARKRSDALLGAIMVLRVAEANMCMPSSDWRNHTAGAQAFMRDRAQQDESRSSLFGWDHLVERQFVVFHFWGALIARQRIDSFLCDDAPALFLTAQEVPGALQDCDELCCSFFTEERALTLARRLKAVEADLMEWTTHWNRCMREAPFQLVSSTELPFPYREQPATKQTPTFPLVFRFNDLSDALDHSMCAASMLAVKSAMLDLSLASTRYGGSKALNEALSSVQTLTRSITTCADTLCMTFPYLHEPQHGKFGGVATAPPLGLALNWYRRLRDDTGSKKAVQKLAWCRDAAAFVQKGGIRMLR